MTTPEARAISIAAKEECVFWLFMIINQGFSFDLPVVLLSVQLVGIDIVSFSKLIRKITDFHGC